MATGYNFLSCLCGSEDCNHRITAYLEFLSCLCGSEENF
ncbi:hypothetical protein PLUTE_b0200 [Pseudoalteromonas luteoviolacea DSM 6061]|nr:hypothetical protein [Pseudoalteromonas luteoviolacea DSM 6061]